MGVLLAFAPFIVFAIADRLTGSQMGLIAGAAASAILIMKQWLKSREGGTHSTPKLLELATFLLFAGLAIYQGYADPEWSIIGVRLRVDAGLLIIILAIMAIGKPFTLQYAREQAPPERWNSSSFIRTNYVISAAWALAFGVMVVAELALLHIPALPRRVGVFAIFAALYAAVKFTSWYPEKIRNEK